MMLRNPTACPLGGPWPRAGSTPQIRASTTRHLTVLTSHFGFIGRLLVDHVAVTGSGVAVASDSSPSCIHENLIDGRCSVNVRTTETR